MQAKYINPFTDFGFKKLFGEEVNKDLMIDFLNEFLPSRHKIKDLFYKKTENLGAGEADRKAIFDIYCESELGDKFIVELQKAKQNFFKDRTVFYSTFPIREQAEKGDWNYELKAVYCIAILDFVFEEDKKNNLKYLYRVQLKDDNCEVFYDKLSFIFVEMPKFNKTENDLQTHFDKWLYFIKNLENFDKIPAKLQERAFEKAFSVAEIAKFNPIQVQEYENSLKYYRDLKNIVDTSFGEGKMEGKIEGKMEGIIEGKMEGIIEGKIEIARSMKKKGYSNQEIAELTGLSLTAIEKL
jgi:predicted transposase/invertase (TIGR01784 family)